MYGNKDISVFKFADDGTIRIKAPNTHECLKILNSVCIDITKWTSMWRMVINCDPSKTELICFGTAENDKLLIPADFPLGNKRIKFVEKTKALGLILDKDLSYIEHGKYVNRKALHKWVTICKYTNRNWGFKQHVIVRLLEVLLGTCICYAGIVWMNTKSLAEVKSTWYKVLKSATGAVFNIKLETAEILLGVPPLETQNRINSIKHILKMNILPPMKDPLKDLICHQLSSTSYCRATGKMKDAFQFLKWKMEYFDSDFTEDERSIIENSQFENFGQLSVKACSYTKGIIRKFIELLWQSKSNSIYQLDGYQEAPKVYLAKLAAPSNLSRKIETLTMSLFYPNNLLAPFLYRYDSTRFTSPLCPCGRGEQTASHILLHCKYTGPKIHSEASKFLNENQFHPPSAIAVQTPLLLSWSRIPGFLQLCIDAVEKIQHLLVTEISL